MEASAETAVNETDGGDAEDIAEESISDTEDGAATQHFSDEEAERAEALAALMTKQHSELAGLLNGLSSWVEELSAKLTAANKAITVHEEIERNLNNELQRYKNDFYDKLASPFLLQFIGLYTDMEEEIAELKAECEKDPDNKQLVTQLKSLEYYADSVQGALINNSVEIKTPAVGEKYDYREQRIVTTIITDDIGLKDKIAEVRSDAFIYNGKVLRPAKVVVYMIKKYPLLGEG